LAAGLSRSGAELIAARVVQGAAAAAMAPQVLATFRAIFSGAERGKAFSVYGGMLGVASAVGLRRPRVRRGCSARPSSSAGRWGGAAGDGVLRLPGLALVRGGAGAHRAVRDGRVRALRGAVHAAAAHGGLGGGAERIVKGVNHGPFGRNHFRM